ncbi:MAG: hypothetical protein HYU64_20055 [Armatimonadetes bacterium]|nr:hypothetical protein [Armatimonadota bacterium]
MAVEEIGTVTQVRNAQPTKSLEKVAHPPEVADPQPKEPTDQVTLTTDADIPTNLDIDQLRVHLATRYGDTDNAEALQVKEEYREAYDSAASAAARAQDLYKEYGVGTHTLDDGSVVTITNENGHVSVSRETEYGGSFNGRDTDEARTTTVTYDEKNPDKATIVTVVADNITGDRKETRVEKDGTAITTVENGVTTVYDIGEGGTVVKNTTNESSGISSQVVVNLDGSTKDSVTFKGPGGVPMTISQTRPPDFERAEIIQMVDDMAYVVNPDGSKSPLSPEQRESLVRGLHQYDIAVLRHLHEAGLQFAVVDPHNPPEGGYPGGNSTWPNDADGDSPAGGYYTSSAKTIVLRKDNISGRIIAHEVGHAIDDYLQEDIKNKTRFRSDNDPELRDLFDAHKERAEDDPEARWSSYALNNRHEYLAEGIAWYLDPNRRDTLKEKDPELYAYVEKLLAEAVQENPLYRHKFQEIMENRRPFHSDFA